MRGRWLFAAFGAGALIAGLVVSGVAGAAKPGTAATNSGRLIPLESNVTLPPHGSHYSYMPVDSADCETITAHFTTSVGDEPTALFSVAIPGESGSFGATLASVGSLTIHNFSEYQYSAWVSPPDEMTGVHGDGWEVGPQTILHIGRSPLVEAATVIESAYLYCIPR